MKLEALVVSAQVEKLPCYDAQTGQDMSSYAVNLAVLDAGTLGMPVRVRKYDCLVTEGLPRLDGLNKLRQSGSLEEVERELGVLRSELALWFVPGSLSRLCLEVFKLEEISERNSEDRADDQDGVDIGAFGHTFL